MREEPLERDPVVTVEEDTPAPPPARVRSADILAEIKALPAKVAAAVGSGGSGTAAASASNEVTFVGEPPPVPQAEPPTPKTVGPVAAAPQTPVEARRGFRFPAGRRRVGLPG